MCQKGRISFGESMKEGIEIGTIILNWDKSDAIIIWEDGKRVRLKNIIEELKKEGWR